MQNDECRIQNLECYIPEVSGVISSPLARVICCALRNVGRRKGMDIDLILKVAGVGMIITVVCQIMSKAGKDEQSTMVSLAGTVIILILIAERVGDLIKTLRDVFGL